MTPGQTILLVSPEKYDGLKVSKHHYAMSLANRGYLVYFLNPPTQSYEISNSETINLKVIDYPGFFIGMRYLPYMFRKILAMRVYSNLIKLAETKFDIIWSFDNSVFYDFDFYEPSVLKISHIVDLNMNFNFKKSTQSADICFSSTRYILARQKTHNKNSHFIHHGCATSIPKSNFKLPFEGSSTRIGYAGNLDIPYLDWSLLELAAKQHFQSDFYLAGTWNNKMLAGFDYPNVHHVGKLNSSELHSFYDQMDILILFYKADKYKEQVANPHKLMEYLLSGKMIVCTFSEEYHKIRWIYMSKQNSEWPSLLTKAIRNLKELNMEKPKKERISFAMQNSYLNQIRRIEQKVNCL